MSTISVHDIQGFSTYSNTVRIPNGHKLDIDGDLVIPTHTTGGRPAGELGAIGFNSTTGELEVYVEINGTNQWYALTKAAPDGSNAANAAVSGQQLITDYPSISQGVYWIKSSQMSSALQMYVDVTEDGGGYDFYARKKLLWDGENMKITNLPEANQFVTRKVREGWEI